jgi:hypothetical protein
MQLFCQACQAAFSAMSHCPKCGARLLSPQECFIATGKARPPLPDLLPPTFAARLAVGVGVALLLVFGLRECASGFQVVQHLPASERWTGSNLETTTLAIRLIAVFGGGLLVGAGRRFGMPVGAVTGLIVGLFLTLWDIYAAGQVRDISAVLLLLAYPVAAALAGGLGAARWPADAELPEAKVISSHGSSMARLATEDALLRKERPTHWIRIAMAATFAVMVLVASDPLRFILVKYSGGVLQLAGAHRGPVVGLQLATLAAILAGLVAGMGTGAGLKHGLLTGLLAAAGAIVASANRPDGLFPAIEGFFTLFQMDFGPLTSPRVIIHALGPLVVLVAASGWLGGNLFPPLAPKKLWKRRLGD